MAFTNCRKCEAEVSIQAKICPQCRISDPARPHSSKTNYLIVAFVIIIAMALLGRTDKMDNVRAKNVSPLENTSEENLSGPSAAASVENYDSPSEPFIKLTKLLDKCGPVAAGHDLCDTAIYQPVWRSFETTSGLNIKVDIRDIDPAVRGGALAWIYTDIPGEEFDDLRLLQYYFTCNGKYTVVRTPQIFEYAPPNSAMGVVAEGVCAIADSKRRAMERPLPDHGLETGISQPSNNASDAFTVFDPDRNP